MQSIFLVLTFSLQSYIGFAQIKSGPLVGYVEHRTAKVWIELDQEVDVQLKYWKKNAANTIQTAYPKHFRKFSFHTVVFDCVNMEFGQTYNFEIYFGKKASGAIGSFTTQDLWQWRKPAPDYSFLSGSCSYHNEPIYDRPGKPYGGDSSIYAAMIQEKSAFMLWLGDNWYTREVDYFSEWGLWYRASRDRHMNYTRDFYKSMPQIATWDDHDFGPNNEGVSYILSKESREVFQAFWANPSYGAHDDGIYTKVNYYDTDLFLLDNRTWRASDDMLDSINGKANDDKIMFGTQQMTWLKNALLNSRATFKIIVAGSPMLNRANNYDCWIHYPNEHQDFLNFLSQHRIKGVLFLTGDRHHSEIHVERRDGLYPLYDITTSSLTSGITKISGPELNNPQRLANCLVEENNYARFSISGLKQDRKLKVDFVDKKGITKYTWEVNEKELK